MTSNVKSVAWIAATTLLASLFGSANPAHAAAPTVSVDLDGSGCSDTSELMVWGDTSLDTYFDEYWSNGSSASITSTATCNGHDFQIEWQDIELVDSDNVVLTLPALGSKKFKTKSGTYSTGWGNECIDSDYRVATSVYVQDGDWGSPSEPSVTSVHESTISPDGSFDIEYPISNWVMLDYPGTSEDGQNYLGSPPEGEGDLFAEKCGAQLYLSSEFGFPNVLQLKNETTHVDVALNYPDGFDYSSCEWEPNDGDYGGYFDVYRGRVEVSGHVQCGENSLWLQKFRNANPGDHLEVELDVVPLNLVTIEGTVDFAQAECSTFPLTIYNGQGWDWQAYSDAEIGEDGSFSLTIPEGPTRLYVYSQGDDQEFQENLCQITDGELGFVRNDLTGVELHSDVNAVTVTLEQPDVNDVESDCTLYDPNSDEFGDPELDTSVATFGAPSTEDSVSVQVWCGDEVHRSFDVPYTAVDNSATATLTLPDLTFTTLTGKLTLPTGFPEDQVKNLEIWIRPDFDILTGESHGWSSEPKVKIDAARSTYTVTLPLGDYRFSVYSRAVPDEGCYVNTWYPNTTYQFAEGLGITASTRSAPPLSLLAGGRIRGHATFDERITDPVDSLSDQVYNLDGVSYAWMAGDGTPVDENGNFFVYQCLPPGKYYYQAGNMWTGIKNQFYDNVTRMENATPLTIPKGGGDTKPFEMHFMPLDKGAISGTVVDAAGDPLSDYTVVAYDAATESFRSTQTDAFGVYELTGLDTPGQFTVVAFDWDSFTDGSTQQYAYFPSDDETSAERIRLSTGEPSREEISIVVPGDLDSTTIVDLYPWFANMNIAAPAEDFDGLVEALLDGDVAVDEENTQLVELVRNRAALTDWSLDVEVNFNTVSEDTVGAYGYANGALDATELGEVSAADDIARVQGTLDLQEGINFVSVTGATTDETVVVPILYGDVAPTVLTLPSVSGPTKVGKKLRADTGVWVGNPEITSTALQWLSCPSGSTSEGCKTIKGAKKSTLELTSALVRRFIAVRVTVTSDTGSATETVIYKQVR